jgi:hypothetical protein
VERSLKGANVNVGWMKVGNATRHVPEVWASGLSRLKLSIVVANGERGEEDGREAGYYKIHGTATAVWIWVEGECFCHSWRLYSGRLWKRFHLKD